MLSFSGILIFIGWAGMNYVLAELPRVSYESLLHQFKEGVFIVDEDTSHLQFINKAACAIIKVLSSKCNLSLLSPSNDRNASTNVSVDLKNAQFQAINEKHLRSGSSN